MIEALIAHFDLPIFDKSCQILKGLLVVSRLRIIWTLMTDMKKAVK